MKYDNKISGPTMFTDSIEMNNNYKPPWKLISDSILNEDPNDMHRF